MRKQECTIHDQGRRQQWSKDTERRYKRHLETTFVITYHL
jgi:hypothetical protein